LRASPGNVFACLLDNQSWTIPGVTLLWQPIQVLVWGLIISCDSIALFSSAAAIIWGVEKRQKTMRNVMPRTTIIVKPPEII
jgi:hypothetical protein